MEKEVGQRVEGVAADELEKEVSTPEKQEGSVEPESSFEKKVTEIMETIAENSEITETETVMNSANEGINLDAAEVEAVAEEEGFKRDYKSNIKASRELNKKTSEKITALIGGNENIEPENPQPESVEPKSVQPEDVESQTEEVALNENELAYLQGIAEKKSPKVAEELRGRYEDSRTEAGYVLNQLEEFSKSQGAEYREIPELEGRKFDAEAKDIILQAVQEQIDALLLSKEGGRFQKGKHESVSQQTKRFAELIKQAQKEGDIPQDLEAQHVLRQLQENVAALAFQDLAASENTLGDHGIRHLVDHNITISERILDQIQEQGQEVRAVDRLMVHQIMIDHDIGYAMDPVREPINTEGARGQDAGHNLLAAKFIKQRSGDSQDSLNKIFGVEQIAGIHEGILNHDSSEINIKLDNSAEARQANLESAVHIADNTHAFEDKLPELLYSVPESLKTMRLMKAAAESGDSEEIEILKESLLSTINASENYSETDKKALSQAIKSLTVDSYKFSVGRICGNKPEVFVTEKGGVEIQVEESAIHQEVARLFEQGSYDQLKKFIADLTGVNKKDVTEEMLNQAEVGNDKLKIILKIGEGKTGEGTDYQKNIETLIEDADFREWVQEDNALSESQKVAEKMNESAKVEEIKKLRQGLIKNYNKQ